VAFPGSLVSATSSPKRLVITPHLSRPDLPRQHDYTLEPGRPTPGLHNLLRPHIALDNGTGILTSFPSDTAFALSLGADSPCADERCAGNLGLSARELFTPFIATHVSIRTSDTSSMPLDTPSQAYRTLSYHMHAPFNALQPRTHPIQLRSVMRALLRDSRDESATSLSLAIR
jgi:hypothetical protein